MSYFRVSRAIEKELVVLQRDFLLVWKYEGRKIVWVKWENMCKHKHEGELGIKDIRAFN